MNYILQTEAPFEMVTVRYGADSGTDAVKAKRQNIYIRMPGLGPVVETPVTGRHGGTFTCFGDYSVDLFRHIDPTVRGCFRALFDMAAVAIVKNPTWATATEIPCPVLINNAWVKQPNNPRKIIVWENFEKELIHFFFYLFFVLVNIHIPFFQEQSDLDFTRPRLNRTSWKIKSPIFPKKLPRQQSR